MGDWVCYLLRCADDTLYCGITNDLEKRLAAHNSGEGAKYTRGRAPVKLVHTESFVDKSAALKREMQIKQMKRGAKQVLCGVTRHGENP
jgi:putative endonuclease